jgi:hypothetical protein
VISDANAEAILASLQTPETERNVIRVPSPQIVIFDGKLFVLKLAATRSQV